MSGQAAARQSYVLLGVVGGCVVCALPFAFKSVRNTENRVRNAHTPLRLTAPLCGGDV